MIKRNVKKAVVTSDVLLDGAIKDMQGALGKLAWIDTLFGRAYRLVRYDSDGDKVVYPAAYNGKSDYVTLEPSDDYGNFIWFDVYDPQKVVQHTNNKMSVTYDMALVCWYDQRKVMIDDIEIVTEPIKAELMNTLTQPGVFRNVRARVNINAIYEDPVNVYKSYSMEKIYNRFDYAGTEEQDKSAFMYPYAGLRIDFEIEITHSICR